MKYLYGASVQGIQNFIFETNKLKEISGASELVDHICSDLFQESLGPYYNENNLLTGAAGNIKYLFDDYEGCQELVRKFPMEVMSLAPGITISQTVIKVEEELGQKHLQQLEEQLKTQRNRLVVQQGLGLMVSERSRRTGKPGVEWQKEAVVDAAQQAKRDYTVESKVSLLRKLFPDGTGYGSFRLFPQEMEDITGRGDKKNWIAVIHADGNDLGRRIMNMVQEIPTIETYQELSKRIKSATEHAIQKAFEDVVLQNKNEEGFLPFRPIIIGGDDVTVIIRGDLAIDFTHSYLKAFEEETINMFADFGANHFQGGLTACAGIAYIKENYPFHYGANLAETLCAQAKRVAKDLNKEYTPSCLLFHKVHSSFIEDYSSIVEQELTAGTDRLDYGPYFLASQSGYATVSQLNIWVSTLNESKSPKSRLRNWLSQLQVNSQAAIQEIERIKGITNTRYVRKLQLDNVFTSRGSTKHTHLFDAIELSSIENNRK